MVIIPLTWVYTAVLSCACGSRRYVKVTSKLTSLGIQTGPP